MKLSLRSKFLIPTVMLVAIGLGFSSILSYFISGNAIENCIRSQLIQLADSGEKQLSLWIKMSQMDMSRWSDQNYIIMAVRDTLIGEASRKAANAELAEGKKKSDFYESVNVANLKGDVVSSSDAEKMGNRNVANQQYFQEAIKGRPFLSDIFASPVSGKPVFVIAYPIDDKDVVVGVLFGIATLDNFSRSCIDLVKVGAKGYVYLVNKNGFLATHPDKSLILKFDIKAYDFGKEMTTKEGGIVVYTFKDAEKIVGFKKNAETGWVIAVDAEIADVMSSILFLRKANFSAAVLFIILIIIVVLLIVRAFIKPLKHVVGGLKQVSEQIGYFSEQVATASQKLAETSSEQASSVEETSASLEEVSSMVRQNVDSAIQADKLMKETNSIVKNAASSIEKLIISMGEINKAGEETSKIIKIIDEIAFQTNLLALNAAVEAARAGEAGAGFAVVANEVRNLAMRTAEAAKNTAALIEDTTNKVKDGSQIVDNASKAFSKVAESTLKVGELLGEITVASNEQAQGIEQVTKSSGDLDRVIQENAAQAQESASLSDQMNAEVKKMKGFMDNILVLVEGSTKLTIKN